MRNFFVGKKHELEIHLNRNLVYKFSKVSGDTNPLHLDVSYAKKIGHSRPLAHGALQIAIVSQSLGKWLIGDTCLISSYDAQFLRPLYYPNRIKVLSEIIEWSEKHRLGKVITKITDQDDILVSEIITDLSLQFNLRSLKKKELKIPRRVANRKNKKTIIIVGATSGLISGIIHSLFKEYNLILLLRSKKNLHLLPKKVIKNSRLIIHNFSDYSNELDKKISAILYRNENIWGAVYAAHKGNFDISTNYTDYNNYISNFIISSVLPIELAKILIKHSTNKGGRFISIGSNYAINNSPNNKLLNYGLIKSLLINTSNMLSKFLAPYHITSNTISPDFMNLGMNKNIHPSIIDIFTAENPRKKLCSAKDVLNLIIFLLDKKSDLISGQEIKLHGGKT